MIRLELEVIEVKDFIERTTILVRPSTLEEENDGIGVGLLRTP